jgi:hypothetical protein
MSEIGKGLAAGFVGTVVTSALMFAKTMMGLMPDFNVIKILSSQLGRPDQPVIGWAAHFLVGTVLWGGLFGMLVNYLPGNHTVRGTLFGIIAWLLMMVVFFPYVGAGFFGGQINMMVPVVSLLLHVIFGAVMGATHGALRASQQMKQEV